MASKNSKDTKCSARLGWAFNITIISLLSIAMLITLLLPSPTSSNPNFAKRIDPKTPFVEDNARVLTAKTRRRIADLNQRAVVAPGQPQLLVVTVDSLKGVSISDLADKKGRQYGIGSKDAHPGLVYVVSVKDRKDHLATSDTMHSKITKNMAVTMLESKSSRTAFSDGDFDKGVNTVLSTVRPYFLGERKASDYPKSIPENVRSFIILAAAVIVTSVCTIIAYHDVIDKYGIWPFVKKTKSPRDDDDAPSPDDSN